MTIEEAMNDMNEQLDTIQTKIEKQSKALDWNIRMLIAEHTVSMHKLMTETDRLKAELETLSQFRM